MFSPNESEPVLNSYYEENLKSINNSIADMQKTLDKTEDEEARESLQNDLNSMNEWLTEYEERGKYDVSPEQIEIYRAFGDNMTVQESLIWNMDDGASQIQQYLDGAMNAACSWPARWKRRCKCRSWRATKPACLKRKNPSGCFCCRGLRC